MQIGRRIYYEKSTGNVILNTGERSGDVIETTIEQDFQAYISLNGRVPESVGCIELAFGEYAEDFNICSGYHVDLTSESIVFDYTPKVLEEIQRKATLEERIILLEQALDDIILNGGAL